MSNEIDIDRLTPKLREAKELRTHPKSFRIHPPAQREALSKSLTEHGWLYPALLNVRSGYVLNGNACIQDAIEKGYGQVPVIEIDVDTVEEEKILSRIDRIPAMVELDLEALKRLLSDLNAEGVDLDDTGWKDFDFAAVMDAKAPVEGKTDPDAVPEAQATVITRSGDLWSMGGHRLLCGDSTDANDVLRVMDGGMAHLLLTDPPVQC